MLSKEREFYSPRWKILEDTKRSEAPRLFAMLRQYCHHRKLSVKKQKKKFAELNFKSMIVSCGGYFILYGAQTSNSESSGWNLILFEQLYNPFFFMKSSVRSRGDLRVFRSTLWRGKFNLVNAFFASAARRRLNASIVIFIMACLQVREGNRKKGGIIS